MPDLLAEKGDAMSLVIYFFVFVGALIVFLALVIYGLITKKYIKDTDINDDIKDIIKESVKESLTEILNDQNCTKVTNKEKSTNEL